MLADEPSDFAVAYRRASAEGPEASVRTKHMSAEMRKRRVKQLLLRDGNVCWLCNLPMARHAITVDHVIPRSKGGTHEMSNLKLAHKRCNGARGNASVECTSPTSSTPVNGDSQ